MALGAISDYSNLLQNYYVPTIPSVSVEQVRKQDEQANSISSVQVENSPSYEETYQAPKRNDAALEDISITFNKQEGFDYLGKDSDIQSLDMQKAISDMQKDQILHQYQYFVGSSNNLFSGMSDGKIIIRE